MEQPVRAYLTTQAGINFAANVIINGLIAWLLNRHKPEVTLGEMAFDLAVTTLLLVFLVSLLATAGARRAMRSGDAPHTAWKRAQHPLLRRLPSGNAPRATVLAVVLTIGLVAVVVGLFVLLGLAAMTPWAYIVFKALYTGLLGAGTAWISHLAALGEPPGHPATATVG